jgi:type II secretory pathway component GspD/PulD (secretin)
MKTRLLALLTLIVACSPAGVDLETRTFRLESLEPHDASEILEPYVYRDRADHPGTMTVAEGAITVRETADNLARIERVLEEFDRPVASLRLRFQVVEANGASGSDPEIAAVEQELRKLFRFEGYRLVGEGIVTVANGARFQQQLTGGDDGWLVQGGVYRMGQNALRLREVQLWFNQPLFETSVNVRVGQTLVIGSARSPTGDGAVILVVEAVEE